MLSLSHCQIIHESPFITALSPLRGLEFNGMKVSQDIISEIAILHQIEELRFWYVSFDFLYSTLCLAEIFRYDKKESLEGKSIPELQDHCRNHRRHHFYLQKQFSTILSPKWPLK